jgi:nucleoside-diphosphate-sugar epimerase
VLVSEETTPAPGSAYGRSKLRGTDAVLRATATTTLDGVVLRVANAIGPGAPRDSLPGRVAHQLAEFSHSPEHRGPAPIRLAPLQAIRDFVDVRDVADAVFAAADAPDVTGRIVNIAGGAAVPVRDLVHRLIELSGVRAEVIEERPGAEQRTGPQWQRLDVRRACALLGWQPQRGLDESLTALLAAGQPCDRQEVCP